MKPIVEKLEADKGVAFRILDADSEVELSHKYSVRSIPTFVYVEDGVEISRASGAQTGKELATALSI
jgi:thioredoxin-like negative regulator of GroEL